MRTSDPNFLHEVTKWYDILMPKMETFLHGNNGNIFMVQVENEYGALKICDNKYKEFLRDLTLKYIKNNALLFTTDRPLDNELQCGKIDGVFATTDFGIADGAEISYYFQTYLRSVQPNGPLVNSEFYTGWLTHWQEPKAKRNSTDITQTLLDMLYQFANVNLYMFHGGTNFGFWAGANDWGIGKYMADMTSYDYDAPLDEAGDPTEKYEAIAEAVSWVLITDTLLIVLITDT